MSTAHSPMLFTPIALREVELGNRIVVSPMCQYSAADGFPTDWHFAHLSSFALGGAGLVFTEAASVEERGRITHGDLGIWSDDHGHALEPLAGFLLRHGTVPAVQLAHAGRKASMQRPWHGNGPLGDADLERGEEPWEIVAPSPVPVDEGWLVPRALEIGELPGIAEAFADAARRAHRAGFEVAEIHGAHGYLLHSFLSPITNKRDDEYGGARENRMRFPLEVAEAVRAVWPEEKPLFYRISAVDLVEGGWELEDSVAFAKELKVRGIDVVDCSSGGIAGSATAARIPRKPGFQVPFAARIKREADVMTQAVGLIMEAEHAESILQAGDADLIAIAREALYDPFWPRHAAKALGVDPEYERWPEQYGWWLRRRDRWLGT